MNSVFSSAGAPRAPPPAAPVASATCDRRRADTRAPSRAPSRAASSRTEIPLMMLDDNLLLIQFGHFSLLLLMTAHSGVSRVFSFPPGRETLIRSRGAALEHADELYHRRLQHVQRASRTARLAGQAARELADFGRLDRPALHHRRLDLQRRRGLGERRQHLRRAPPDRRPRRRRPWSDEKCSGSGSNGGALEGAAAASVFLTTL